MYLTYKARCSTLEVIRSSTYIVGTDPWVSRYGPRGTYTDFTWLQMFQKTLFGTDTLTCEIRERVLVPTYLGRVSLVLYIKDGDKGSPDL